MKFSINSFQLKLIAIVTMFINHIYYAFQLETYLPESSFWFLAIGRLTFPIMAFLLVEGFHHTKNKWQYAGRLLLFALISIVPYHFLFDFNQPFYLLNNVFFTLFFGLALMIGYEILPNIVLQVAWAFVMMFASQGSDWGPHGVFLIYVFYLFRGSKWVVPAGLIGMFLYREIPAIQLYQQFGEHFGGYHLYYQFALLLVIPLLMAYKGERGPNPTWLKWGFYAFYPAHIALLWGLRYMAIGY